MKKLTISVLIPTWKRPNKIRICLQHMMRQVVSADEIIVIMRKEDSEGVRVVSEFFSLIPALKVVYVETPGVVNAENAGISVARGDIIAFIDDDGYAPETWVKQILDFFYNNEDAAGYGGSDIIKSEPWTYYDTEVSVVGKLCYFGKVIGNHHRKALGTLRKVDVLKGVNMSFKKSYITKLDTKLSGVDGNLGNGSQWELDLCLYVKASGGDIYFDPTLVVVHDSDHSTHIKDIAAMNNAHNLSYVFSKHIKGFRYLVVVLYSLLIGNEQLPGLLKLIFDLMKSKTMSPFHFYKFKMRGFFQGMRTYWEC